MYNKYHEFGFEVVGYSCDSDLNALNSFLASQSIPWRTISQKASNDSVDKRYVDLIQYYGIAGIPKMILIDAEGKVVDVNAKGARLQTLLQQAFPNAL